MATIFDGAPGVSMKVQYTVICATAPLLPVSNELHGGLNDRGSMMKRRFDRCTSSSIPRSRYRRSSPPSTSTWSVARGLRTPTRRDGRSFLQGFAIQKDSSGYYIRFSSSLNEVWGQGQLTMTGTTGTTVDRAPTANVKRTFEHRPLGADASSPAATRRLGYESTRERRDLPKEWAQFFELVLARDLKLGLLNAGAKHDRIVSRGIDGASSKLRRFEVTNPDSYLDVKHPGTAGTGQRFV